MAKTNPAIANTNLSKIERATALYAEVTSKAAPEGTTHRRMFMDRAGEIEMSEAGANTYFQTVKQRMSEGTEGQATPTAPARISQARAKRNQSAESQLEAIKTQMTDLNRNMAALAKKLA